MYKYNKDKIRTTGRLIDLLVLVVNVNSHPLHALRGGEEASQVGYRLYSYYDYCRI